MPRSSLVKNGKKKQQETHQMVVIRSLSVDYLLAFGFHGKERKRKETRIAERVFFYLVHFLEFSSSCLAKEFCFYRVWIF